MGSPELDAVAWIKSSYSGDNGGNCVQIAPGIPGSVPVRDSKVPYGPILRFDVAGWDSFIEAVKRGELAG
ncbi:hypothetical protein ADL22_14385 [Streptomyces sp. NRRL F-4489]|uniref:DUF397 domain-containing protein n=1 Tax=Streptomyces sp. NRRL F-4489 TaxID=1609095 RepID=UPI0007461C53|nr:DUF397 domain-containing protein [Streptomyces sp. NRRL F-4489]KUL41764.1 hypothetical protein ADL22_14385 [Streptomyces sp. NRRL F-4489]